MDSLGQSIIAETAANLGSKFILWTGGKAEHFLRRLTRKTHQEYRAIADPHEREIWDRRLRTVLEEIGDAVADADAVESESYEPAAQRFTYDALRSAIESPSEQKRRVLGRLIIRRMESRTETFYELQLREAQAIARDSSPDQIACLAAVFLLFHTPVPQLYEETHEPWFLEALSVALNALATVSWTHSDLDHLFRAGALWHVEAGGDVHRSWMAARRFPPELHAQVLALAGQRPMDFGSTGAQQVEQRPDLSGYWLSAAGSVLAAAFLERLIDRRVYFLEWEERTSPASCDLIAPFDSAHLAECVQQRGTASEMRVKQIIKYNQEEQVRRLRSRFPR